MFVFSLKLTCAKDSLKLIHVFVKKVKHEAFSTCDSFTIVSALHQSLEVNNKVKIIRILFQCLQKMNGCFVISV